MQWYYFKSTALRYASERKFKIEYIQHQSSTTSLSLHTYSTKLINVRLTFVHEKCSKKFLKLGHTAKAPTFKISSLTETSSTQCDSKM